MAIRSTWRNSVRQLDVAANDSDKIITVPADTEWEILGIQVKLVSTGTVGNRRVEVVVRDGADAIMFTLVAGAVQAASATVLYSFGAGLPRETTVVGGALMSPLPQGLILAGGWDIRILDSAAVDAAADDMDIAVIYTENAKGGAV